MNGWMDGHGTDMVMDLGIVPVPCPFKWVKSSTLYVHRYLRYIYIIYNLGYVGRYIWKSVYGIFRMLYVVLLRVL